MHKKKSEFATKSWAEYLGPFSLAPHSHQPSHRNKASTFVLLKYFILLWHINKIINKNY